MKNSVKTTKLLEVYGHTGGVTVRGLSLNPKNSVVEFAGKVSNELKTFIPTWNLSISITADTIQNSPDDGRLLYDIAVSSSAHIEGRVLQSAKSLKAEDGIPVRLHWTYVKIGSDGDQMKSHVSGSFIAFVGAVSVDINGNMTLKLHFPQERLEQITEVQVLLFMQDIHITLEGSEADLS